MKEGTPRNIEMPHDRDNGRLRRLIGLDAPAKREQRERSHRGLKSSNHRRKRVHGKDRYDSSAMEATVSLDENRQGYDY